MRFGKPLICTTVVMPGPIKDAALPRRVLTEALRNLDRMFNRRRWHVVAREVLWESTGPEALHVVDADAGLVKSATIELEDSHALGRLWDLDVIGPGPRVVSRKELGHPARRCLVCERPAFECSRSRRHPPQELTRAMQAVANLHDKTRTARRIGEYAAQAVFSCGSHRDMDAQTFLASARAISPWFPRFVASGLARAHVFPGAFLPFVRRACLLCEEDMLRATGGVNTHKGAIDSLGLLCAAAGRLLATGGPLDRKRLCAEVAAICGARGRPEDLPAVTCFLARMP
jgi:holo-ACP synthase/triphosphoribosyl-dephospho-CoA synthase